MSRGIVYLHQTEEGKWEVSRDHGEWARFPTAESPTQDVLAQVSAMFYQSLIVVEGPRDALSSSVFCRKLHSAALAKAV